MKCKSCVVVALMFQNLPYQGTPLKNRGITQWERNHFKKWKCCTFNWNNMFYFRNL